LSAGVVPEREELSAKSASMENGCGAGRLRLLEFSLLFIFVVENQVDLRFAKNVKINTENFYRQIHQKSGKM